MKKAIGGMIIICVLLVAFVAVRPVLFGEDREDNHEVAESYGQATEEPDVESVIASAVNPTKEPVESSGQPDVTPKTPAPTVVPTAEPTAKPTAVPTATPTPTPKVMEIPEPTKVPTPVVTVTPKPMETETPVEDITDEDIAYVAELLEVPEDKVREVIARAEEEGYVLDPDEILSGNFDIIGAWGIVTDVFGKKEAALLLLKVMKLGIF